MPARRRPRLAVVGAVLCALVSGPLSAAENSTPRTPDRTSDNRVPPPVTQRGPTASFDGRALSDGFVKAIAPDPVVAWGTARDSGGRPIDGQLWLLVEQASIHTYYHLSDDASASGPQYGGYRIDVKAIITPRLYNAGAAGELYGGNDRDAFLVTTTRVYLRASGLIDPRRSSAPQVAQLQRTPSLAHAVDFVESYKLPAAASAGHSSILQVLDPDGSSVLFDATGQPIPGLIFSMQASTGSPSSVDCEALGETVAGLVTGMQGGILSGINLMEGIAGAYVAVYVGSGASVSTQARIAAGGVAITPFQSAINGAVMSAVQYVTGALYSAAAEFACHVGQVAIENLPDLLRPIGELADCGGTLLCEKWTTEQVGSTSTYGEEILDGTSIETIEVSPVLEPVCSASQVVFTCAEI